MIVKKNMLRFAKDLIKKGKCFVIINDNGVKKFYPSRFVGYKDNTKVNHVNNDDKDGKITNPAISTAIGTSNSENKELDKDYILYVRKVLNVELDRNKRTFWEL